MHFQYCVKISLNEMNSQEEHVTNTIKLTNSKILPTTHVLLRLHMKKISLNRIELLLQP